MSNAELSIAVGKNYFSVVKQGNANQYSNLYSYNIQKVVKVTSGFHKILEKYVKNTQKFRTHSKKEIKSFTCILQGLQYIIEFTLFIGNLEKGCTNEMPSAVWYNLHNLKKREKHPWRDVTFSKATLSKLYKWCQTTQSITNKT